jgi:hypothetical protein
VLKDREKRLVAGHRGILAGRGKEVFNCLPRIDICFGLDGRI